MNFFLIALIKLYQKKLSPGFNAVFFGFFTGCRFYPSCSEYSIGALENHGFIKGSLKSILRILKCGPWTQGGIDIP